MTPESLFMRYKALSEADQKEMRLMVNMIVNWEQIENHTYKDTYLARLKNVVQDAMYQVKQMA